MRRDVYHAISDPTRRDIIGLIAVKPMNLNAIAENFSVSRPAISQHIKILEECGLIHIRQVGRERYCEATLQPLAEISGWLERFRAMWQERHNRLDEVLERLMVQEAINASEPAASLPENKPTPIKRSRKK